MMGKWIETTLQDVAIDDVRAFAMGPFGSNIKSENYRQSGVPVIRGTNLGEPGEAPFIADGFVFLDEEKADSLASSNCLPNDIVFVAQGTVGKVGIVPHGTPYRRFVLSQNLMKVTVDQRRADPRFVFYFYRSHVGQHEIMSRVNPTGVPCISKPLTSLRQFGIRLPSDVKEQQAIACILGALDDKIELNRRMNKTLEETARAIFKSWFVDFDPVRAKAACHAPLGLKPEIATLFPDSFEESELGNIPKGWHVYPLGDVCEFVYGKAMKASDRIPGPVAVMGSNGQVGWHNVPLVKGPGVVVGRKGNPGIVTWVYRDFYPIDTTFYVAPNTQTVTLTYLFEAIMRLGLPGLSADSAVPGLNRNIAYMSRILVPDPGVLRAFDQQAITLYQRQFQADEQSCTLAGVRDFLLPGKVYMSPETLS